MIDPRVIEFISEHHVLNLATCSDGLPYCASCYYAFSEAKMRFILASSKGTKHISHTLENPNIAGTIALECEEVGLIRGIQFTGKIAPASLREKALYLKTFPLALAMNPTIWSLHVEYIKFTDNRLGFGKKLEFRF